MPDPPRRLIFGLRPPPSFTEADARAETRVNALLRWVGERVGVTLVRRHVDSYDELSRSMESGAIDVAWLPPIPFARLSALGIARELVSGDRGGEHAYVCALLARAGSRCSSRTDLPSARMGWVDPLSATGYVVPRMRLAARGAEPRFASETFYGSHVAVIRAILDGAADVGASYAGFDEAGMLVRGAFLDVGARADDFQVVDSFGSIPPDVLAVHARVDAATTHALACAFEATRDSPEMLDAIHVTFGVLRFVREPLAGYDLLRAEVDRAVDSGAIPASTAMLSTRPPPSRA